MSDKDIIYLANGVRFVDEDGSKLFVTRDQDRVEFYTYEHGDEAAACIGRKQAEALINLLREWLEEKMKKQCGNCRFWEKREIGKGYCKAFPPSCIYHPVAKEVEEHWPKLWDDDYCGQWEPHVALRTEEEGHEQ